MEERTKSEIEKQFEATVEKVQKEIKAEIDEARKHIRKAEQLSEQYGVPFRSGITPLSMGYMPSSFEEKWSLLIEEVQANEDDGMDELLYDVCGTGYPEYSGTGWEHSAVC